MLNNIDDAKRYLLKRLRILHGPFSVSLKRGRRDEHFEMIVGTKHYYCLFKKKFFYKFGEIFNTSGAGESINKDVLDYIEMWAYDAIIFIYPDKKVYFIDPYTWVDYVKEHNTIRETSKNEVTTSVSIRLLQPLFKKEIPKDNLSAGQLTLI